jgi:hypothetical protein
MFASLVLCVLGCVLDVPGAYGREGVGARAPRIAVSRGALAEARGARQADRAQQRAARLGPQSEAPAQRTTEPPMQPVGPSADPAVQGAKPGRLTPDERRALRQQINEAGRDVYRPNRP